MSSPAGARGERGDGCRTGGPVPTTEVPPTPSNLVEPAGLIPTAEEKRAIAEHERLVGAGAGRSEAEEQ